MLLTLLSMFMLKKQLLPAAISTPENRLITTKVSSGGQGY
jgi:hypothetical protein